MEVIFICTHTYINSEGENVYVSEEHLDRAIEIKEELQKMSPTRRCSWSKHKKMMEQEGFNDSDSNENYRCLVKRYQKSKGRLKTAKQHAELVADSKLNSIKQSIGEMNSAKLDLQEQGRQVRKLIRSANKDAILIEEIRDALSKTPITMSRNPVRLQSVEDAYANRSMIVCLSDIHYGAHVDIAENYYDTKVAAQLLREYAGKVIDTIKKEHVTRVDIVNLGDIIEHAYMRNQNLYDSEETLSEQIVNVTRLIIDFLQDIRDVVELVSYRGISGNHDRMQGDKNSNLNADTAVNISNQIIKMWIKMSGSDIDYIDCDNYFTSLTLNSYRFAFVHGDRNNLNKQTTLAELGELHDEHYDAVIGGHLHRYSLAEVGNNRYQAIFGSIKGMDDYSMKLGRKASRSQGIILIDDYGFDIRKVALN